MALQEGAPYKGEPSRSIWLSDALIELVAEMIGLRYRKGEIKRELAKFNATEANPQGEPPSQGVFERLMREARELIRERLEISQSEAAGEAIAFYESVIRDPDIDVREKLRAQDQLERLLGLGARFAQDGDKKSTRDKVEELRRAFQEIEASEDRAAQSLEAPTLPCNTDRV